MVPSIEMVSPLSSVCLSTAAIFILRYSTIQKHTVALSVTYLMLFWKNENLQRNHDLNHLLRFLNLGQLWAT